MSQLSLILPVHNRRDELVQTLESVSAQTFADFEAIIVNDRSSDGADELARAFSRSDARFKVLDLPADKRGAPAARNFGVTQSSGEFVIFLDSDDLLAPTCFEHRVAFMKAHPALDFAVYQCGLFRKIAGDVPQKWNHDTGEDDLSRLLKMDVPWQTTSPIWQRTALDRIGGWDESVLSGQDWEFHIRAVASGLKYQRVEELDCYWRMADADRESIGKSSAISNDHARNRPATIRKMLAFLRDQKKLWNDAFRQHFVAMYWQAAHALATRTSRAEARVIWREAFDEQLISRREWRQGNATLFAMKWPGWGEKKLANLKKSWPASYFVRRGKYYNRAPIDPNRPPRVSVVMSAYNTEKFVEKAVDSILRQSFRDFEFIIIDDGSTDSTGSILEELASTDCRIRLVRRENKGLTVSLNEAIALSRGEFIARMDGDDIAIRERFARQIEYLDANPDCVLLGTHIAFIDPFDVVMNEIPELLESHEQIDAGLMKGKGGSLCHPSIIARRDAIEKVGGYRDQFNNSEDLDLFLRLAEVGRVHNLSDVLLHYRRHPGSINHTKFENQRKIKAEIVRQAHQRRGLPATDDFGFAHWQPKPKGRMLRDWGWNALMKGQKRAARSHAWNAVKAEPFSIEGWKLMVCVVRGH